VGCGTGANLAALARVADPFGVDISPLAVAACRARGLTGTVIASAASLPFPATSFDAVLSCDVLNSRSLPDRRVPLREMARVLRPAAPSC
jgi:ubiquinone/menaquinone biosynthesis C-methylase UbiE